MFFVIFQRNSDFPDECCAKPTANELWTNNKGAEYNSFIQCITEYSSGFLLLLVKQPGIQHVKSPLLLLELVDESGLLPLLSGLPNLLKTED